jgi:flagellar basal body-associated protein FliL
MKKIGLILGLVNTVVIAAVLGLFIYTRVLYKRPPITEEKERAKIAQKATEAPVEDRSKRILYPLEAVTVNLDSYPGADGKPRSHYASMTLTLELRRDRDKAKVDSAKPVIMDKIIQNVGRKAFEELNQVQGRYVFKSQVIDETNEYLKEPIVTEVFLTDFMLQ